MALFSIVVALLLEQLKPFAQERFLVQPLERYARLLENHFNDGQAGHGALAWVAGVLAPALAVFIVLSVLNAFEQPEWVLVVNIAVLYATMGFRQSSHFFNDIHMALRLGELDRARALCRQWLGMAATEQLSSNEVARLAIEKALLDSHRHDFGPLCCFVVLGPAGAVIYRLAVFFSVRWGGADETAGFGTAAVRAFVLIDWLPQRLSASAFAVVGDFEDAIYCWRTQAARWPDITSGIVLASGAGALGVRLGAPIHDAGGLRERPELGLGDAADADFMRSTIGLVWRSLVLCLLLLALFWVAGWLGR